MNWLSCFKAVETDAEVAVKAVATLTMKELSALPGQIKALEGAIEQLQTDIALIKQVIAMAKAV